MGDDLQQNTMDSGPMDWQMGDWYYNSVEIELKHRTRQYILNTLQQHCRTIVAPF